MLTGRLRRALVLGAAAVVASGVAVLASGPSYSHGYTTSPTSRSEFCALGTVTNCGEIQYEPQSVEAPKGFPQAGPPDGHICAGNHSDFTQLDDPRNGTWPVNHLTSGAQYTFTWHLTAQHATTKWEYFITNSSYNPTQPLTRAMLTSQPFYTVQSNGQIPPTTVSQTGTLPSGRTGRALILAVWTIADTANAFYQCSDVSFS